MSPGYTHPRTQTEIKGRKKGEGDAPDSRSLIMPPAASRRSDSSSRDRSCIHSSSAGMSFPCESSPSGSSYGGGGGGCSESRFPSCSAGNGGVPLLALLSRRSFAGGRGRRGVKLTSVADNMILQFSAVRIFVWCLVWCGERVVERVKERRSSCGAGRTQVGGSPGVRVCKQTRFGEESEGVSQVLRREARRG